MLESASVSHKSCFFGMVTVEFHLLSVSVNKIIYFRFESIKLFIFPRDNVFQSKVISRVSSWDLHILGKVPFFEGTMSYPDLCPWGHRSG